jgi:hypothetical protein
MEPQDEAAPECGMMARNERPKPLSVQRRRELLTLAEEASDWIIAKGIKPHELCFFKQAVSMLTDTRD